MQSRSNVVVVRESCITTMGSKQPVVTKNTFEKPPNVKEINPEKFRVTVEAAGFLYIIANVIQVRKVFLFQ